MYKLKINKSDKTGTIKLTGSLGISNSSSIKEELLAAVEKTEKLVLDQSEAEGFDLSYLQILIALKNTVSERGKKLEINNGKQTDFDELVRKLGYTNALSV